MKVGPNADFPVFVQAETGHAVRVTLNHFVAIFFAPDLAAGADEPYVVTPDDARADGLFRPGRDEFAQYLDELERIEDRQLGPAPLSELRQYRVAALLTRLATSGRLDPDHARLLGAS